MTIASVHRYLETGKLVYVVDGVACIEGMSQWDIGGNASEWLELVADNEFWLGESANIDNPFDDEDTECLASLVF